MMRLVLLVFLSFFSTLDVGLTGWTWSTVFVGMRVRLSHILTLDLNKDSFVAGLWNTQLEIKPSKRFKTSAIRV